MNLALQEELKRSRKSDDTEERFDVIFTEPLGMIMARLFIRLGFTPNMVTLLSMFFGVCGGVLFYPQKLWVNLIGILLEIFAAILDCSDGQVARLTNTRTQLGRVLDGVGDGVCFAAVYLGIGFRLMKEPIPFTNGILWGVWIWPLVLLCGLAFHLQQCRMADYYRNAHLYFLNNAYGSELSRSAEIREELAALPQDASAAERLYLCFYYRYTKAQERQTPKLQRLLQSIEANGGEIPEETAKAYVTASRRYLYLTNLLTFNLRAYSLYLMVLLGITVFYFPFVIVVLGLLEHYMIRSYERIAGELLPGENA